jgi:hypothetical protein
MLDVQTSKKGWKGMKQLISVEAVVEAILLQITVAKSAWEMGSRPWTSSITCGLLLSVRVDVAQQLLLES